MNFYYIFSAILLLLFAIVFFRYFKQPEINETELNKIIEASIAGEVFLLEVADTPQKQSYGLMNREELADNAGMLFVFDYPGIYPFWMKDTLIPLDIIWLNESREIVYIKENAEPCSNLVEVVCSTIVPTAMAKYVVEVNAGKSGELDLKIGDKIEFEF